MKDIVHVKWVDSKGVTSEWEFMDDMEPLKPCPCESTGFLIASTPDYVTVAQSVGGNQVCGRMTIPRCSVVEITNMSTTKQEPK